MRYAAAMKYGGQLVDAADCDYEDYKKLILLCPCPNCKEPVFLREESTQIRNAQTVIISAHFAHFSSKAPALAKLCDERVKQYDERELEKRATVARNQRLKLLQKAFWLMFSNHYEQDCGFPVSELLEHDTKFSQGIARWLADAQAKAFCCENKIYTKDSAIQLLDDVSSGKTIFFQNSNNPEEGCCPSLKIQEIFRERVIYKIDQRMQRLICYEVLDFLWSKRSFVLLKELFTLATWIMFDALSDGTEIGLLEKDGTQAVQKIPRGTSDFGFEVDKRIFCIQQNAELFYRFTTQHVLLWLVLVPWAEQFNKMQQPF